MNSLKKTIKVMLTQNLPKNVPIDSEQHLINIHYTQIVDEFIENIAIHKLEQNNDFNIELIPMYFSVYKQGMYLLSKKEISPIIPILLTQELIDNLVNYFSNLPSEICLHLNQIFLENSFVAISSWYKELSIKHLFKTVYSVYPPIEWYERVLNEKTLVPDNVTYVLKRIQTYINYFK